MTNPYIGGIGQGIGSGLQNLAAILLDRQQKAEERQREEEGAQSLMAILAALMQGQGGPGGSLPAPPGAGMVPGEEVGRPAPEAAAQAPATMPPEFQALTDAIRGTKIKDEGVAKALLTLGIGLTGQRREHEAGLAKEKRDAEQRLREIAASGEQQRKLEGERRETERVTAAEKRKTELSGASSEVSALEKLFGVPAGTGEQMFPGDPMAAQAFGQGLFGLRQRGARGEAPQTPAQKNALRAIAKSIGDRRRKAGLGPLFESDQDLEAALDDPEAFRTLLGRGIGLEMETMGKRFELADYDRRYRLALKKLDLAATKMKLGAKEREEMLSMASELLSTVKYGELSNITESQVRGQIEKLKKLSKGIPGVDSTGVDAAVEDIETEFFKGGAKEDETPSQRTLAPVPQTLSMRKWTQEQWNRYIESARGVGMTVPEMIEQLATDEGLSVMERYSLEVELGMR